MRSLIVTQNHHQPNNGQAVFCRHLAEGLAARGHDVMVATPSERGEGYGYDERGTRVEAIPSLTLRPWYPDVNITPAPDRELRSRIEAFRPDIIHIQDPFPLCRGAVREGRRLGLPLVGTNHFLPENILPFLPTQFRRPPLQRHARQYLWNVLLRVFDRLDAATAPTETAATLLREQGLKPPVEAISCGVDLGAFGGEDPVDPAVIRRQFRISPDAALFLFVGRIDRAKHLDVLIRAIPRLTRRDIQLAIVGDGRDLPDLKSLANRLRVADRVIFTGYVDAADLPRLLRSADVFAMPSEAELLSIATLEAMASGLPVLAADACALPELVTNTQNGYLFHAGDVDDAARRMAQLADERSNWPTMGRASRERASAHALRGMVTRYETFYARVLHERRGTKASIGAETASTPCAAPEALFSSNSRSPEP